MDKNFGMSTDLNGYLGKGLVYVKDHDSISLRIHDGVMELYFDDESDREKAKDLAGAFIDAYIFRSGIKIATDFNHSWQKQESDGVHHNMRFESEAKMTDDLQVAVTHQRSIKGTARIVNQEIYDGASFENDEHMAMKVLVDETLHKSLRYYAEEVVDVERPMYGVYKSIEVIIRHLGRNGKDRLAQMAGKPKSYVRDLLQAAQFERHSSTDAKVRLSEDECKKRAKLLIEAYASAVTI